MILLHLGHEHLPTATTFWDFLGRWDLSPAVLIPLAIIGGGYLLGWLRLGARSRYRSVTWGRTLFFGFGYVALLLALVSPIDVFGGELFFMHMIQHLLLMMVAAPLLLLASPMAVFLWALPEAARYRLGRAFNRSGLLRRILQGATVPVMAWLLYAGTIWLWHAPFAYDAALEREGLHSLEHLTMFGVAVLFWWPVIGPAPIRSHLAYPLRFLYLFMALFQNIIVGAFLTFADSSIYSFYQGAPEHWGVSADVAQQLGGLIMWILGAMMYVAVLSILFFAWIDREEREAARWQADQGKRGRYLEEIRLQRVVTRGKESK